ncbi:TIR domain-containing protein [Maledivibacter halophilus]|uniref:Predicted nucleotide-binding protein containing TIR-like domain n=1 Tax=Maledivibacter halophilus TaxID=36842 RepID=A0A1T5KE88_9FIRM|nr:nucleotide-binding protein [Maledivibacter halophilus]SKC61688.1 Predicted nucleotide-binding protein containing TIR-like domain [Maledivibacter halophilus]
MKEEKLLVELMERIKNLNFNDDVELDAIKKRMYMIISNIFGKKSKYLKDLGATSFYPMVFPASDEYKRKTWNTGQNRLINITSTMLDELKLFPSKDTNDDIDKENFDVNNRQIFLVHGHNEAMKQTVARVAEKIDFNPIILHEKENKGRTIIEKFTDYSEVGFAIVLLSGDDLGGVKSDPQTLKTRARQNVIFEMGYFIGKLGRDRVVVLYTPENDFEMPSDYSGVIYIEFDNKGVWKFELAKELKSCGYDVNLNKLL